MATATETKNDLGLTSANNQTVARLAWATQIASGVFLLLGAFGVFGGVVVLFQGGGFLNAAWIAIQSALSAVMGLVLLAVAADFSYLAKAPMFGKVHLKNAVADMHVYFKVFLTLAVLLAVVFSLKLLV